MNIVYYITGHGFGHASRSCEIISALHSMAPESVFYIRSSVPQWFFYEKLPIEINFDYCNKIIDIGVVQKDAFHLDKRATLEQFEMFWKRREILIDEEIETLPAEIDCVISDISPIPFLIAEKLKTTSVALSNFIWSWIYDSYMALFPEYAYLKSEIESAYSKADLALRYPFYGDFSCFTHVFDLPLVAAESNMRYEEIRGSLGISPNEKLILCAFGGFSPGQDIFSSMKLPEGFTLLFISSSHPLVPHHPSLAMPDLLKGCDLLIGKPGYGMVSECIAAEKPFLYTSRGDFAEYKALVDGMKKYIPCSFIPRKYLLKGDIMPYVQRALSKPFPKRGMKKNGNLVAACKILNLIKK